MVIGGGIVGSATAWRLARQGVRVTLVDGDHAGAASGAAAGLLAPSIGTLPQPAAAFFHQAAADYQQFLDDLNADAGAALQATWGLLELRQPLDAGGDPPDASQVPEARLAELEPGLTWNGPARLHPRDGAIDPGPLVAACRRALRRRGGQLLRGTVERLALTDSAVRVQVDGMEHLTEQVVIAAGAWSPTLAGVPRAIPIVPLRGQLLVGVPRRQLTHPVMAGDHYLVPRGDQLVVGATSQQAGFDASVTDADTAALQQAATRLLGAPLSAPVAWTGLRPMTPDRLPVIGRDPDQPRCIWATGHSRNGYLLADATAQAVASIVRDAADSAPAPAPFAPDRFDAKIQ
jgi:glycine oxidase